MDAPRAVRASLSPRIVRQTLNARSIACLGGREERAVVFPMSENQPGWPAAILNSEEWLRCRWRMSAPQLKSSMNRCSCSPCPRAPCPRATESVTSLQRCLLVSLNDHVRHDLQQGAARRPRRGLAVGGRTRHPPHESRYTAWSDGGPGQYPGELPESGRRFAAAFAERPGSRGDREDGAKPFNERQILKGPEDEP